MKTSLIHKNRMPRRSAERGALLNLLVAFLLSAVLAILLAAGCSGSQGNQQQQNEELQQKVDKLQKQKQQQANQQHQPQVVVENNETNTGANPAPEGVVVTAPNYSSSGSEAAHVLSAAKAYYQAAEVGDYNYTYDHLSTSDQARYTHDQWVYANNALNTAAGEFVIHDVSPESDPDFYSVSLTVSLADGSSFERTTEFTYEPGRGWVHSLTSEEYDMFNNKLSASATASATPTASAATTQTPSASETTTTQSASSGGETCTLQGTLVRPWEGSVAPDTPYGVKPCMAKDGSFRLYIPLMDANPMQLYLQGANEGDYDLMYDQLNSQAQTWYTREQWDAAMQKLHTGDNTYEWVGSRITTFRVDPANSGYSWIRENNAKYMQFYQAEILVTYPDGSQETVYRSWIGGYWKQSEKQDGMGIILTLNQVKAIDGALGIHTYVE
jgi:hypothetical protein